jgi:hypothetical protein
VRREDDIDPARLAYGSARWRSRLSAASPRMNDPEGTHRPRYCRVCRLEYEPIDRQHHRRRHTEWMRPRRPKPSPRFADNVDVIVDETSPTRLHKLVYERARALMRDEGFSSNPQWNID